MRIAILMSNTDETPFARRHPKDGEKWRALLAPVCPGWDFPVFSVKDGDFPASPDGFDGFIVTGSPASVHDPDPWIARLFGFIRAAHAARVPLFGACFGHQAIALALGGTVGKNPGGWVFGVTETVIHAPEPWMGGERGPLALHAAHVEQVTTPPAGAHVHAGNAACPVGGYALGDLVFATQYHPEIDRGFMTALIDELADRKPETVIRAARASLGAATESPRFARWIRAFFETARGPAA